MVSDEGLCGFPTNDRIILVVTITGKWDNLNYILLFHSYANPYRIHGWYIYLRLIFMVNVGKYTIHGCDGVGIRSMLPILPEHQLLIENGRADLEYCSSKLPTPVTNEVADYKVGSLPDISRVMKCYSSIYTSHNSSYLTRPFIGTPFIVVKIKFVVL